jgi:hypothetical protein
LFVPDTTKCCLHIGGTGNVYRETGYKTLTPIQLCNVVATCDAGIVSFRALRVYFACFELLAVREAARRSRKKARRRGEARNRFQLSELRRVLGMDDEAAIRRDLSQLRRAGLAFFAEEAITVAEKPLPDAPRLLSAINSNRSPVRPIPVPRPVLTFLARSTKPAVVRTVIAYLLRGLTLDRKTLAVKARGTVKLSWIVQAFGVSLRAARYARAELVRLGWFGRDESSFQRKLNRDGAYFRINLAWRCPLPAHAGEGRGPGALVEKSSPSATLARARIAPPEAAIGRRFAPLKERPETPYGSKNQETRRTDRPGVSLRQNLGKPTIRDVRVEDLQSFTRTEELYWQAVAKGLIGHSEANALNWVAAAVRAKSVVGDSVRVFMGIVRRQHWRHITQEQEERARTALARYREDNANVFRVGPKRHDEASSHGHAIPSVDWIRHFSLTALPRFPIHRTPESMPQKIPGVRGQSPR